MSILDNITDALDSVGEIAGRVGDVAGDVRNAGERIRGSEGSNAEPEKDVQRDVVANATGTPDSFLQKIPYRIPLLIAGGLVTVWVARKLLK